MASFNAVIRLRRGPDPDGQIDAMQQTFARRSMPFVWWVTQEDSEDGLEARLRNHRLDYDGEESMGMAIALPSQQDLARRGESVSVERIVEQRDMQTWFATLLESFGRTPDEHSLELDGLLLPGQRQAALHLGSTAGLYSVGTAPTARRQGVGTALTNRALRDASSAGHTIASLMASGRGARLYGALGFKAYCRFREYVWRPSPSHQAGKRSVPDSGR